MKGWMIGPAVLVLSGCGAVTDNVADNIVENAVEQAVERAVESETGGEVSIDLDSTGDTMVFSVETPEGEQEMVIGGGEIPEDFPVPVPDGVTVLSVAWGAEGGVVVASLPAGDFDSARALYDDYFAGFDDTGTFESQEQLTWGSEVAGASVSLGMTEGEANLTILATP